MAHDHDVTVETRAADGGGQLREAAGGPLQRREQPRPCPEPLARSLRYPEYDRIETDGDQRSRDDQALALLWQEPQRQRERRQNERELADLSQARRDRERRRDRVAEPE